MFTDKDEQFFCTFSTCTLKHLAMTHDKIIDHIKVFHRKQNEVCPICVERGGKPNFKSSNLTGHLNRHLEDEFLSGCDEYSEYLVER